MRVIQVIILGQGTAISYQLSADEKFSVVSTQGEYSAANIYRIEVDWKGKETLLYVPGEVVEFASAYVGMELLEAIRSGERKYIAPNSSKGENEHD